MDVLAWRDFDCSSLTMIYLRSLGVFSTKEDYTANDLYLKFKDKEVVEPYRGCLVFFKNANGYIVHVEIMLSDIQSIGASGGDSSVISLEKAIEKDAYVKIKSINYDKRARVFVDPLKE